MAVVKQKYSKIILWVALVLHILIIFSFSIQNAKQSTVVSEKFAGGIKSEEKFYKDAADEKKTTEAVSMRKMLRKILQSTDLISLKIF